VAALSRLGVTLVPGARFTPRFAVHKCIEDADAAWRTATTIYFADSPSRSARDRAAHARAASRHYPTRRVRRSFAPAIRVFPSRPSVFADF